MQSIQYMRPSKKTKESLLAFLLRRFPYHDEAGWRAAIERGSILLNGKPSFAGKVLESRQVIGYQRPIGEEPKVDSSFKVLLEDEHLLLVEKSGNLPITESGRYHRNTLVAILKAEHGYTDLFTVHRLDRETSGIVLIAKTSEVARRMAQQFVEGLPKKIYHAVLTGVMQQSEILLDAPLAPIDPMPGRVRIRQIVRPEGKACKTLFRKIRTSATATLVEIQTFTGRTHQIRAHAEHLGQAIVGDKLYGQPDERFLRFLDGLEEPIFPPFGRIPRQLLHASKLSFQHPITGQELVAQSPCEPVFSVFGFPELLGA